MKILTRHQKSNTKRNENGKEMRSAWKIETPGSKYLKNPESKGGVCLKFPATCSSQNKSHEMKKCNQISSCAFWIASFNKTDCASAKNSQIRKWAPQILKMARAAQKHSVGHLGCRLQTIVITHLLAIFEIRHNVHPILVYFFSVVKRWRRKTSRRCQLQQKSYEWCNNKLETWNIELWYKTYQQHKAINTNQSKWEWD